MMILIILFICGVEAVKNDKLQLKRIDENEVIDLEYFKMQIKHEYIN